MGNFAGEPKPTSINTPNLKPAVAVTAESALGSAIAKAKEKNEERTTELAPPRKVVDTERIHSIEAKNYRGVLQALFESGAIKFTGNDSVWAPKFELDPEKARAVTTQIQDKPEIPPIDFPEQKLKKMAQQAMKKVIKDFVDNGIIPTDLAVAAGKLIKPSGILLTDFGYGRFMYLENSFPTAGQPRADLEIGSAMVLGWAAKKITDATNTNKVQLSQEQIVNLVLRNVIAHEYGHVITRTKVLRKTEEALKKNPEDDKPTWQVAAEVEHQLAESINHKIAPNPRLDELLSHEPEAFTPPTHEPISERIAVGFENLELQYALKDLGIDRVTVDKIASTIGAKDLDGFSREEDAILYARSQGLNMSDIAAALYEIKKELGDEKLSAKLPTIDTHRLGYYHPLTEPQVRELILSGKPRLESQG